MSVLRAGGDRSIVRYRTSRSGSLNLVVEDLHAAWAELLMALQLQQLQRGVGEQHTRHCGPPSGVQNASIDVPNNKVERERQRDRQSERGKERQRAYILEAPY